MQLCIDRNGDEPRVPARIEDFQVFGAVGHDQGHGFAGLEVSAHCARELRGATRQFCIGVQGVGADGNGGTVSGGQSGARQVCRYVHCILPASARTDRWPRTL